MTQNKQFKFKEELQDLISGFDDVNKSLFGGKNIVADVLENKNHRNDNSPSM